MNAGRGSVVTVAFAILAAGPPYGSAAVNRTPGEWSLRSLAGGSIAFRPAKYASRDIAFRVRRSALGPDRFFLVHLRFDVVLAPQTGIGALIVGASTNGLPAAQTTVVVERRAGVLRSRVDSTSIVRNAHVRRISARGFAVDYVNYLREGGVRAGRNVLTLHVERLQGIRVQRVVFRPSTAIVATPDAPAELVLDVRLRPERAEVGDLVKAQFLLLNRGDRSATDVTVRADVLEPTVAVEGRRVARFEIVDRRAAGEFVLRAKRPGPLRLALMGASSANQPGAMAVGEVTPARRVPEPFRIVAGPLVGAALGVLVLAAGFGLRRRIRRRQERATTSR
jgi:hypothetical protein